MLKILQQLSLSIFVYEIENEWLGENDKINSFSNISKCCEYIII